jgi:phosphate transport system permease protein
MPDEPLRRRRRRTTRASARIGERLARSVITVGGVGTICAVGLIFLFLGSVVLPLFKDAAVAAEGVQELHAARASDLVRVVLDEYRLMAATVFAEGRVELQRLDDGVSLGTIRPFGEARPTAWSSVTPSGRVAVGFDDGMLRLGTIGFLASFPPIEELPDDVRVQAAQAPVPFRGGLLQTTGTGELRLQEFVLSFGEPVSIGDGEAIRLLDHSEGAGREVLAAWCGASHLSLLTTETRMDFLTGTETISVSEEPVAYTLPETRGAPERLLLSGLGDNVFLAWGDGRVDRVDVRDPAGAYVAEVVDLVPNEGERLTALEFLLGRTTLVSGDSAGRVRAWFRIKPADAGTIDGAHLVPAHEYAPGPAPVTALSPSERSRLLAVGHADGTVRLLQATTEVTLAELRAEGEVIDLRLAPKEDALVAAVQRGEGAQLWGWSVERGYPEAGWTAFFRPVWYEGYERPDHVWQSVSGTDDFEPKLGLVSLVFGTLKATLYSLLFGAPLAFLAALFTSEFLERRLRTPVKSTIEMMASLPSVVLGFLAAIVIAPFAERIVPAILSAFVTLPCTLLLGAYVWQLLPQPLALRWIGRPRLLAMACCLPIGIVLALVLGPWAERLLFAGDLRGWLDGGVGAAAGGWFFLLVPAAALLVALGLGRGLGPWARRRAERWSRATCARFDLVRFALGGLATLGLAAMLALALDGLGLDPRGNVFDTFEQRNALVVGFVMGFAIIPIIYTLAEDALSSVPEHLRLASLGAGATPWQTAARVIVPTAMSGLFSALMIGLGRAVGETMIVLMATGNTPVMEWNVFNGFRTLSANIAVELPEAVAGSTHYRTLFLAALALFAMTFTLNTAAEIVRQRFRRRAWQL